MFFLKVAVLVSILWAACRIDAAPTSSCSPLTPMSPNASTITSDDLIAMGAVSSCSEATQFPEECRTAEEAAPLINHAFSNYSISSNGERAALLSTIIFESGGFEYNRNHWPAPGNPGQGTRNMMGFPFVFQYASQKFPGLQNITNSTDPDAISSNQTRNDILGLVLTDELSFASAMWFYTNTSSANSSTACMTQEMMNGLEQPDANLSGWKNYISTCLGTNVTDDREKGYKKALNVFNVTIGESIS